MVLLNYHYTNTLLLCYLSSYSLIVYTCYVHNHYYYYHRSTILILYYYSIVTLYCIYAIDKNFPAFRLWLTYLGAAEYLGSFTAAGYDIEFIAKVREKTCV